MMILALAMFMVGSVLCALAPNIELLTAFRVMQGFGGGGLMTLSQALIGEAIPPRERGRYQGYLAGIAVSSNTFGPVAGGYLTQAFGWQSIFLVNIPLGLLAMLFVFRHSAAPGRPPPHHVRCAGTGAVHFLRRPGHPGARTGAAHAINTLPMALACSPSALVVARSADLAGTAHGVAAHSAETVQTALDLARRRHGGLHGAALVSLITFLPIYLRAVRGASPAETGLILLPLTAGIGIGSMITGQMVTRTGYTAVFPTYGLLGATAGSVRSRFLDART